MKKLDLLLIMIFLSTAASLHSSDNNFNHFSVLASSSDPDEQAKDNPEVLAEPVKIHKVAVKSNKVKKDNKQLKEAKYNGHIVFHQPISHKANKIPFQPLPALHYAARHNNARALVALLEEGAQLNRRDHTGATPLHWAAAYGHIEALCIMFENRPDEFQNCLMMRDAEGKTPIHRAVKKETGCLELLAGLAPDVDLCDMWGSTPLLWAASSGNYAAAHILLRNGAHANAQDIVKGRTALHWVLRMRSGNTTKGGATIDTQTVQKLIALLMEHDADPDITDFKGLSPIDWANKHGYKREYALMTEDTLK